MESSPPPAASYGVVKAPAVQAWLKQQPADVRQAVEAAIADLCENPRPPKSMATAYAIASQPVQLLRVEAPTLKFVVAYCADAARERVTVVGVERIVV